ncbi:hypothetical protein [Acidocella facilis]|uniref:hypothetical protein n=1 Tax=Acidocella facilis TaxID=525 RepID=UPI00047A26A7|nr:hypothetical protein [Acidocella facilis]
MPLLALLGYPLTATLGPLGAYNALMLAAPVSAALSAYALCLYLCRRPGPALLGGWIFGFSSFAAAHMNQHLNLEWCLLLPLLALVGCKRLDGGLGRGWTVALLAVLLAAQAGVSLELFATCIVISAYGWALAWLTLPGLRPRLRVLAADIALAAPVVLLLVSPLLLAMFTRPHDMKLPPLWPFYVVADPLNFFIPTPSTWLGGALFAPVSRHFAGYSGEIGAYLGLPLIFMLWRYLRGAHRFAGLLFLGVLLAALGPGLVVAGRPTGLPLPWLLMTKLPLIGNALPARLMIYVFLLAGIFASLWLAHAPTRGRWLAAALAVACLWPAPAPVEAIPAQPFFTKAEIAKALGPDRRVLILPWGIFSPSMYWQTTSGFSFSQIGGYLVFPPARVQQGTVLMKLFFGSIGPDTLDDLKAYALASGVQDVIVVPGTDPRLAAGIAGWGWPARQVDGVSLYTAP